MSKIIKLREMRGYVYERETLRIGVINADEVVKFAVSANGLESNTSERKISYII